MDTFGNDLSAGGQVLTREELIKKRKRNGQCETCGQKLFKKKLFKLEPITITGKVLDGRCLACRPQDPTKGEDLVASCSVRNVAPAAAGPPGRRVGRGMGVGPGGGANQRTNRNTGIAASMPAQQNQRNAVSMKSIPRPAGGSARGLRHSSMSEISESSEPEGSIGNSGRSNPPPPASPGRRGQGHHNASSPGSSSQRSRTSESSQRSRHRSTDAAVIHEDKAELGRHQSRNGDHRRGGSGGYGEERDDDLRPRDNMRRRDSIGRADSFMQRQTPRPSAVFLEGINIEDLFKDDDDINEQDRNGSVRSAGSENSALGRLTSQERRALRSLDNNNDFLDIVNVMLMNSISETVQNEGLHALTLIHNPDVGMLEDCARSCGFEVIVSAMGKCSKDAMAQTNACKVLFIASASSEMLQINICNAGGIEALVDAMREFDEDAIVLEGSLLALSNLCIPEENLELALEGDLIELAVNALSTNVENCGLQEHGCSVIANLAVHEGARERIRECGGCDTVVVSMVVNPMDLGVQCQALIALRNMCVRDNENKVVLANAGAIDVVIQAMQNHRDDAQVQSRGSWVLGVIGMNEDTKLYIGQNGGADVIIRSMWVHPEDVMVQEKACRALWTLSVLPENRDAMLEVDAITAVVATMRNHAAEPNIQERGCGVLCNLAANEDDLKIQIVEKGALDVVVMAMVLHGENEMIQERAVALMFKLCIRENIGRMVNANVSPMMAVVAETFPVCQEKASYVLEHLS